MRYTNSLSILLFLGGASSLFYCNKNLQYPDLFPFICIISMGLVILWTLTFNLLIESALNIFSKYPRHWIRIALHSLLTSFYLFNIICIYITGNNLNFFHLFTIFDKNFLIASGLDPIAYLSILNLSGLLPFLFFILFNRPFFKNEHYISTFLPKKPFLFFLLGFLLFERGAFVYGEVQQKHSLLLMKSSLKYIRPGIPPKKIPVKNLPANLYVSPVKEDQRAHPNIIIIMLESISGGRFSDSLMPALSSRNAHFFINHFSSSNGTHYSIFSVLFGLYPEYYPDVIEKKAKPYLFKYAEMSGYSSMIINSRSYKWHDMHRFLNRKNVDIFDSTWDPHLPEYHRDSLILGTYFSHLDTSQTPLLSYITFNSTHFPYSYPGAPPPPGYSLSHKEIFTKRFAHASRYLDRLINRLFNELKQRGKYDSSLIVIFSDHGEEFGESGQMGHSMTLNKWQTQSFLWLKLPNQKNSKTHTLASSHVDIFPTISQPSGIPYPDSPNFIGKDLLGETDISTRPVLTFQASHAKPHKVSLYCNGELVNPLMKFYVDKCPQKLQNAREYLWN